MALFKILKGNKTNLPENKVDGYCYVTLDEHKLYVDHKTTSGTLERFALNAVNADTATVAYKLRDNAGDENHPVYFDAGVPHTCNTIQNDIDSYDITGNIITVTDRLEIIENDDGNVNRHGLLFTHDGLQFNDIDEQGKGTITLLSDNGFIIGDVNEYGHEPNRALVADPSMIGLAHNMAPGDQVTGMMDGAIGFVTVTEEGDYSPGVILTPDGLCGNADTATLADEAKKLSFDGGDHGTPVYFDGGVPTECDEINIRVNNESISTESINILYDDETRILIETDAGEPAIALHGDDNYIPIIAHTGFYGGALNGVMKFNDNGYHMAGAIRDYVVALDSDSADNVIEGAVLSTDVIGFVQSTGFDANGDPIAIPNGAILTPDGLQGNATTANLADEAKSLTTKVSGSSSLPVYFDGGVPTPIDDLKDIGVIEADSIMIKGIQVVENDNSTNTVTINPTALEINNSNTEKLIQIDNERIDFKDERNGEYGHLTMTEYTGKAATAGQADTLKANGGSKSVPVYFDGGIPHACSVLSLDTTGKSARAKGNIYEQDFSSRTPRDCYNLAHDKNDSTYFNEVIYGTMDWDVGTFAAAPDGILILPCETYIYRVDNDLSIYQSVKYFNASRAGATEWDIGDGFVEYWRTNASDLSWHDWQIGTAPMIQAGDYNTPIYINAEGKPVACTSIDLKAATAGIADRLKDNTVGSTSLPVYFDGGVPTPVKDIKGVGDIEAANINIDGEFAVNSNSSNSTVINGNNISVSNSQTENKVTITNSDITIKDDSGTGVIDSQNYTGKAATAGQADTLKANGGDNGHPIYFDGGIPHQCSVINTNIDSDQVQTKNLIVNNTDDNPVIVAGTNENHEPYVAVTVSENNTALLGSYQSIPIAGIFNQRDDDTVYVSGACGEWLASGIMNDSGTSLTGALITNQMIGFVTSDGINNVPDGAILTPAGLLGNADTATLAEEAKRLKANGGSSSKPVYFDGGVPTECDSIKGMNSITAKGLQVYNDSGNSITIQPNDGMGIVVINNGDMFELTPAKLKKLNALANNTTGDELTPIYFNKGVPTACGDTLSVDITGHAATAGRLTSNGGTSTKPVYFDGGVPTECDIDMANLLPLSAGENKKLTGALGLTEGVMYGAEAPLSGFEGQLFFVEDDSDPLPKGGEAGQILIKNSNEDGDASWGEIVALPEGGSAGQVLIKNSSEDGDASWGEIVALPEGGTENQVLVKNDATDGNASWKTGSISWTAGTVNGPQPNIFGVVGDAIPTAGSSTSGIVTTGNQIFNGNKTFNGSTTFNNNIDMGTGKTINISNNHGIKSYLTDGSSDYILWVDTKDTIQIGYNNRKINCQGPLYGAVWNDYAEYRSQQENIEPGYCVASLDNGKVYKTTEKFQACDGIVSDTAGFFIGQTDECQTPLAVAGRVLAYFHGSREDYHSGDTVCAGPDGKVVKMTREEIREWPDRIIGIVSEIPEYETWGTGNVAVNGRIWIKVK